MGGMRLYLDTEFNGFNGELMSMALVGTAGAQWYQAREIKERFDPWVAEHVVPKLKTLPFAPAIFKRYFHNWISGFDNPEILCDWHADAAHFCNMLAGEDYGSSLDFRCTITILKTPPGQPVSKVPHNALSDAIALRDWHQSLMVAA